MAITPKPNFLPSLKKPVAPVPSAPVAEPEVTQPVEETVMEETAVVEAPKKEKKEKKVKADGTERKTPNRQMVPEDMEFIVANVKTMSYTEMATARGLTKHQVNRVLMTVKQQMRDACATAKDEKGKATAWNEEALAKVDAYIKENLSRPEDTRPGMGGGGGRSSVVKDSIDGIVGNILNLIK
jgi:transcriptional regulator with PAS, ATPase and Fis domain